MKAKIYDEKDKKVFEGDYEYVEAGRTQGQPSFHFSLSNRQKGYKNFEVHFICESDEEFEEMLDSLREQVYKKI